MVKWGHDLCDLDLWPFCMDITSVNGNNSWKFQGDTMTGTLSKRCDRRKISVLRAAWSQLKKYRGHSSQNSQTFHWLSHIQKFPLTFPWQPWLELWIKTAWCIPPPFSPAALLLHHSPPPPLSCSTAALPIHCCSTGALPLHCCSTGALLLHRCSPAAPPLLSCSTAILQAPEFGSLVLICHPNFIKDRLDISLTSDQHWFEFGDPCSCIWFGEETSYYMPQS